MVAQQLYLMSGTVSNLETFQARSSWVADEKVELPKLWQAFCSSHISCNGIVGLAASQAWAASNHWS